MESKGEVEYNGHEEKKNHTRKEKKGSKDTEAQAKDESDEESVDLAFERLRLAAKPKQTKSTRESEEEDERRGTFVGDNPHARKIAEGFRINYMNMKDADTGELLWQSDESWGVEMFEEEKDAHVPREILQCRAVSREINFSSSQEVQKFRLEQKVFLKGNCIEEWSFRFGFVIPGSTNTWQQTIVSAGEDKMIPAEILDGHVVIDTSFYDGPMLIARTQVRIFYD